MFNLNPYLTYGYQRTPIIRCKPEKIYRHLTSCAFTAITLALESLPKQKISFSQLCWFPSHITSFRNITFL